ncbi:exosome catalytic subunit dis3 [Actinomortierella ambigua]|uniref:Ribosomal RNA-processing protein 44 n=1 Tax=Actinomortierella ambigua TaxID=1343610 RepID=A0A9P6UB16_9FUNG|nr:exosome catalytic subunit dis3 [Actinomortierella ambigua]
MKEPMWRQKSFYQKNRSGSVFKVIREHYLRDDIGCGIETCKRCKQTEAPLSATPNINKLYPLPHFLIDLMEKPQISNVIVLQTVLEEVRNLSVPIYRRVRDIIADKDRKFFVFSNEHHPETYIEKLHKEIANDRNDRAIRVATKWYAKHVSDIKPNVSVVLVSDDAMNRQKAVADGIQATSFKTYIEALDNNELLDMVADHTDLQDRERLTYEEHLKPLELSAGVKSGRFYQGKLSISQHNYLEGSIYTKVDGKETTVLILGRKHLNRSMDGDTVVVELLPKSEWRSTPTGVVVDEEEEMKEEKDLEGKSAGEDKDAEMKEASKESQSEEEEASGDTPSPTAKVIGVIRRSWRHYCGFIDKQSVKTPPGSTAPTNVYFWAMDKRIPKIGFRTRQAHSLIGRRIIVAIDMWPKTSMYPLGHFVRVLGDAGDKETETEVLLLEHGVPFQEFTPKVLSFLPPEGDKWVVRPEHFAGREDFRDLNICSIDPPGCTDIDDALHVKPLDNGNYEVGVHIADVTFFVKPGNAMDEQAANRGTTVYLVNKRIDMLPSLLGTNLCSLRSDVERLAFSCIWELDQDANIVRVRFTKSVIASKASFTYEEAQMRIDDERQQDDLTKGIRVLNQLAKKLRQKRMDAGALTLASPEVRFSLERDTQDPVDVEMKELKETNALVEEFMLLANISVARKIYEKFPDSAMLRCHPRPPDTNFEKLEKAVARLGFTIDHSNSKTLSESLDKMEMPEEPYFNKLVRIMTTRCMMQATYFSSGMLPHQEFRHYGLATDIYTHFTSPIRRYSDVMVHRQLHAAINSDIMYGDELTDKETMGKLCDVLNYRHRMAQQAARSSVELYTHLFFKNKVSEEEGFVIRVLKNAFIVLIPKYGIESIVYATTKGQQKQGDQAQHGEQQILMYSQENDSLQSTEPRADDAAPKHQIQLFQKVVVQISIDDDLKGGGEGGMRSKLKMQLVKPLIEGLSVASVEVATGSGSGSSSSTADHKETPLEALEHAGTTDRPEKRGAASQQRGTKSKKLKA